MEQDDFTGGACEGLEAWHRSGLGWENLHFKTVVLGGLVESVIVDPCCSRALAIRRTDQSPPPISAISGFEERISIEGGRLRIGRSRPTVRICLDSPWIIVMAGGERLLDSLCPGRW
jgi:hypothetical protein